MGSGSRSNLTIPKSSVNLSAINLCADANCELADNRLSRIK